MAEKRKWRVLVVNQETGGYEWEVIHTDETKERLLMHSHVAAVEDITDEKEDKKEERVEVKVETKKK